MYLTAKNFGLQEENIKITERETDGQKERERGREDAVLYEKGG